MKIYTDLTEPSKDLSNFLRENWAKLPDEVKEEVAKYDGPGVNNQDRNAYIVECMYANRTKTGVKNKEARELMAGIAFFYGELGLLFFRDGRGEKMANALRRDNGEEGFIQKREDDPAPLEQYLPKPEEEVVTTPAP